MLEARYIRGNVGSLPLPLAVILSGAGGKIAFSDLVEESPKVRQKRFCATEGDPSIILARALYRHKKGQHFSTRYDAAFIRSCGYAFLSKAALPSRGNGRSG